jgi:hypothetical protein
MIGRRHLILALKGRGFSHAANIATMKRGFSR